MEITNCGLLKPFKRTVRQLSDGSYSNSGNSMYLLNKEYALDPQHYIRAFLLIQEDVFELFKFVEPCDENKDTISLRIQELLIRICVEIEANFTAILNENIYSNRDKRSIDKDYCLLEFSHKLSSYSVKFPTWKGLKNIRTPFINWSTYPNQNWHVLEWYKSYNKSKHDRHNYFVKANFDTLMDALSGLVIILSAQFQNENYSLQPKGRALSGGYSYDYDENYDSAIGGYFCVQYPKNWSNDEMYCFTWSQIKNNENPIDKIDFDKIKEEKLPKSKK
ncbi:MAG: hypothetical protein RLZZ175_1024 [Bacteroidota bacterium]|jgi:hypothetical protein